MASNELGKMNKIKPSIRKALKHDISIKIVRLSILFSVKAKKISANIINIPSMRIENRCIFSTKHSIFRLSIYKGKIAK